MEEISLSETVRSKLRSSLLDQQDLIEVVRREEHVAVPGLPGSYRCQCMIAVRRPLDPETAELRKLEVTLRRVEKGWVISGVEGLSGGIDEAAGELVT